MVKYFTNKKLNVIIYLLYLLNKISGGKKMKLKKEISKKEDGRKIIYYSFADKKRKDKEKDKEER